VRFRIRLDIVAAVAVLAALLAANSALYKPRYERLEALAKEVDHAERELLFMAGQSENLARIARFLPDDDKDSLHGDQRFLAGVNDELGHLGLAMSRIEPTGEEPYGAYMARSYKLQIDGEYRDLCALLVYFERLSDVVLVESFDIRSSELLSSSRHRANLSLAVISY
jgi:Tfp pilus assembly protein PilO